MTTYKRASTELDIKGDGRVTAVICTFDVVDHDGDVVTPRAIKDGAVCSISTWNHGSWQPGQPPVGRGRLRTTRTEAIVEAEFFLETQAGRETFHVIRELHAVGIGEWSWSLDAIEGRAGMVAGQPVRFIDAVNVRECSPVMRAASIGTRTISAKDLEAIDRARAHLANADNAKAAERAELEAIRARVQDLHGRTLRDELARSRRLLTMLGAGR
jgi:hypothetical protein